MSESFKIKVHRPDLAPNNKIGLGDIVSLVATPIASALRLPCVDPSTKQLRPESPCAKRKTVLNVATDKARSILDGILGHEGPPDQAS